MRVLVIRRVIFLLVLTAFVLVSCGKTKKKVSPLFEPKSIGQLYGNGESVSFKLKVPLSETSLAYYDYSEILRDIFFDMDWQLLLRGLGFSCRNPDNPSSNCITNDRSRNFVFNFWQRVLFNLINFRLKLRNERSMLSYVLEFPEIDKEFLGYVNSIKVNKVFFSLEDCEAGEVIGADNKVCVKPLPKRLTSFKFIDEFFVNLSATTEADPAFISEEEKEQGRENEFEGMKRRVFTPRFRRAKQMAKWDEESLQDYYQKNGWQDINLVHLDNNWRFRREQRANGLESRVILFKFSKFNPEEKKVAQLKRLEFLKFFDDPSLQEFISDASMIGDIVYLELKEGIARRDFFLPFSKIVGGKKRTELGVTNIYECEYRNCIFLDATPVNLAPILRQTRFIRFDNYLNVRAIEFNDFKYNGYIELEIDVRLPI